MRSRCFCGLIVLTVGAAALAVQPVVIDAASSDLPLTSALAIDGVASWSRRAINVDAVAALVAQGKLGDPAWGIPRAGDTVVPPGVIGGEGGAARAWREAAANDKGEFEGLRQGSYVLFHVRSERARVMLLDGAGHSMFYENGAPRAGDPYGTGTMKLPVALREGDNEIIVAASGRGPLRAKLVRPRADLSIVGEDITSPDLVKGESAECHLGIPVLNATTEFQTGSITLIGPGVGAGARPWRFSVPPCAVAKIGMHVPVTALPDGEAMEFTIRLEKFVGAEPVQTDERPLKLRLAGRFDTRKVTFVSGIDGGVQYYSVVPHSGRGASELQPGLVLSLHGASVEATSQAGSYKAKPGLVIACPTNRRPYGFDWEDWGRADAMEVFRLAAAEWKTDPRRQYLTGHSMGGHGTWQLGVHYPERFAAIAPSAGWLSFATYGGSERQCIGPEGTPGEGALSGAAACSDTPAMMARLRGLGIYILHGDADDNVPVEQARTARARLGELGIECEYHEQPGAGHWWGDASSGAACMDWGPIFEMFARRALGAPADPAASLATELLDENSMPRGSFKRVFARRFTLVYGTKGTPEENAWSLAKARYDAEQWWYRGNGQARIIADTDAVGTPGSGNLILYGNADTNAAWGLIAPDESVRVDRKSVRLNGREWAGEDLGVLAVAHAKSSKDLIGIVAGTGIRGARSLDRLPYFLSGTGFPDRLVVRSSIWLEGVAGIEFAVTTRDAAK